MSLYAIADLHLAMDPSIEDKSMDMFGGPWVNHDKRLAEIWHRLINEDDTVLIPGDISWALKLEEVAADFEWISKLPGKKIIMKGNHDLWWSSRKKMETMFPDYFFLQNNCYEGDNFVIAGSRGWLCPGDSNFKPETDQSIFDREVMRVEASLKAAKAVQNGRILIGATHYPPMDDEGHPTKITQFFTEYGASKVVYGHVHGEICCSAAFQGELDGVDYRLVSLDNLKAAPLKIL